MEWESWGKLWWVIINQPTREEKSIFKVLRLNRTTVHTRITYFYVFIYLLIIVLPHYTPPVLHLIVIILYFRHALWLITLLPRRRDRFNFWNYGSLRNRSRQPALCVSDGPRPNLAQLTLPIINSSRRFWQGLLASQNRSHPGGETD